MNGFFRNRRRNVGMFVLGLACGFAAFWLRSHVSTDSFICDFQRIGFSFISMDDTLVLTFGTFADKPFEWTLPQVSATEFTTVESQSDAVEWILDWRVLRYGWPNEAIPPSIFLRCVAISYPCLVIPLTIAAVWLLLWRRRQPVVESEPSGV